MKGMKDSVNVPIRSNCVIYIFCILIGFYSVSVKAASLSPTIETEGRGYDSRSPAGQVDPKNDGAVWIAGDGFNAGWAYYTFRLPYTAQGTISQIRVTWRGYNTFINGVRVKVYNHSTGLFEELMLDNDTRDIWRPEETIQSSYLLKGVCGQDLYLKFETPGAWDSYMLRKVRVRFSYSDIHLSQGDLEVSYACCLASSQSFKFEQQILEYDLWDGNANVDGQLFWMWASSVMNFAWHLQAVNVQSLPDLVNLPSGIQGLYDDIYGLGLFQALDIAILKLHYQMCQGPEPSSFATVPELLETRFRQASRRLGGFTTDVGNSREDALDTLQEILAASRVNYFGFGGIETKAFSSHGNWWDISWDCAEDAVQVQATKDMALKAAKAGKIMKNFGEAWINSFATIEVTTNPSGIDVLINGNPCSTPKSWHNIRGVSHTVGAYSQVTHNGHSYHFTGWSDGGAQIHTVAPIVGITYIAHYELDTGSLNVTIEPAGARDAGAQWRVDGGTWHNSGYTQSGLTVGQHTVEFKPISGWTTPVNQTVQINHNQITYAAGTYTLQTGSLNVTIEPEGARSAGAQWRVDSGTWHNSGYTQSGLTVGQHTVEFKPVSGWSTPADQTVQINHNQITYAAGTYTIAKFITLTDPNGGERLIAGWMYTVRWQSQGDISSVLIEYSLDTGSNWTVADPCASNIGSYRWLIPNIRSDQCLVRISDTSDPSVFDTSQDIFTIFESPLRYKAIYLGTLGGGWSAACGINDNEQVVGYSPILGGYQHAFLYENGEMTDLGTLGGIRSIANAISESGQIVGYATTSSGYNHAFLYENSLMKDLGTLGGSQSIAYGINNAGQVVGKSHNAQGYWRAFLYDDGRMMDISVVDFQRACDINGKGQIVGWAGSVMSSYACLYEDGTLTDLGTLGGPLNIAYSINETGQIVGISSVNRWDEHAFLYENGMMADLGTLGGTNSEALCINESGQIVGSADTGEGHKHAFLCEDGMMADLNTLVGAGSDITLEVARGINNYGWIVGYGGNANGDNCAFMLVPSALRLLHPDGGEILIADTEYTVEWESEGNIEDVLIEYSINGGYAWMEVSSPNAGNSGSYSWRVPYISSNTCLVRISDVNDNSISDVSNQEFTIRKGIIYVDNDAPYDPEPNDSSISDPCEEGSPDHPFDSMQEAIDVCYQGDTVIVLNGIYTGEGNRDIDFDGKAITVKSQNGPDMCIIDCQGSFSDPYCGFNFQSDENGNSVLDGFTIIHASGSAIFCGDDFDGRESSPLIKNCVVRDNFGEGIYCSSQSAPRLVNCIVVNNSGNGISGICHLNVPDIMNCTISFNAGYGIYFTSLLGNSQALTITNSIIWGNERGEIWNDLDVFSIITYSDVYGGWPGINNIDVDPCLTDPCSGDYHLKSQSGRWAPSSQSWVYDNVTSPCIDKGDPCSDWTAELWPHGKRINMGAYGGTPEASMSQSNIGNIADLNHDDWVDFFDYSYLAGSLQVEKLLLAEDLDRNGIVDLNDVDIFSYNWLEIAGTGLVGHWKFDEESGPFAYDSSDYGNYGQLGSTAFVDQNDPTWIEDPNRGWCLDFDGGDYVKTSDTTIGLDFAPHSFSASAWIKARQFPSTWNTILEYERDGINRNRFGLWVHHDSNNIDRFHFRVGHDTKDSNQILNTDEWFLLTGVYDSKSETMSLYINGQFDCSHTHSKGFSSPSAAKLTIGVRGDEDGENFNGFIDDVRIYDIALTATEIQILYQDF